MFTYPSILFNVSWESLSKVGLKISGLRAGVKKSGSFGWCPPQSGQKFRSNDQQAKFVDHLDLLPPLNDLE